MIVCLRKKNMYSKFQFVNKKNSKKRGTTTSKQSNQSKYKNKVVHES